MHAASQKRVHLDLVRNAYSCIARQLTIVTLSGSRAEKRIGTECPFSKSGLIVLKVTRHQSTLKGSFVTGYRRVC